MTGLLSKGSLRYEPLGQGVVVDEDDWRHQTPGPYDSTLHSLWRGRSGVAFWQS
jgi:hypothetical protein